MARIRLDKLLVKRNFAPDVEQATELIESGAILVNGSVQSSPASFIDAGDAIELKKQANKYVSRGGLKLEKALNVFDISLDGKRCLDVGASTGGFTDCMLEHGASHVVAIDVGKGQLDDKIRHHQDVTIFEKFNAKDLTEDLIGGPCDFAAMDVSFTSIVGLMTPIASVLLTTDIVALIKPQFEVENKYIDTKGIVKDPQVHRDCISRIHERLSQFSLHQLDFSPITGTKGNIEFLAHFVASDFPAIDQSRIDECVEEAHRHMQRDS
jgi:23S rRNA (cytidine1920-2'-O)/16S rRNA (cytidine1409-2'-O)-methyltransferase